MAVCVAEKPGLCAVVLAPCYELSPRTHGLCPVLILSLRRARQLRHVRALANTNPPKFAVSCLRTTQPLFSRPRLESSFCNGGGLPACVATQPHRPRRACVRYLFDMERRSLHISSHGGRLVCLSRAMGSEIIARVILSAEAVHGHTCPGPSHSNWSNQHPYNSIDQRTPVAGPQSATSETLDVRINCHTSVMRTATDFFALIASCSCPS